MTVSQALILGLIQGLSEFLPISSSAHLTLAPWLFGWPDPGLAFDVALHVGTLVAVLRFFREQWISLVRRGVEHCRSPDESRRTEKRRVIFLIIATIPGRSRDWRSKRMPKARFAIRSLIAHRR